MGRPNYTRSYTSFINQRKLIRSHSTSNYKYYNDKNKQNTIT